MEDQNQLIYRRIGHVKNREGNTMTQWLARWRPKKTPPLTPSGPPVVPPLTPSGPPLHFSPRTSNTRLDSIFVEGILNLRPRHSIRPHIKQTIWGQMDFPHIIVQLSLCCGFRHFWRNGFWRHLLKLFSLVALLALQVPLQYRISREGDALVLRDPKCELVLSWTAPLC